MLHMRESALNSGQNINPSIALKRYKKGYNSPIVAAQNYYAAHYLGAAVVWEANAQFFERVTMVAMTIRPVLAKNSSIG